MLYAFAGGVAMSDSYVNSLRFHPEVKKRMDAEVAEIEKTIDAARDNIQLLKSNFTAYHRKNGLGNPPSKAKYMYMALNRRQRIGSRLADLFIGTPFMIVMLFILMCFVSWVGAVGLSLIPEMIYGRNKPEFYKLFDHIGFSGLLIFSLISSISIIFLMHIYSFYEESTRIYGSEVDLYKDSFLEKELEKIASAKKKIEQTKAAFAKMNADVLNQMARRESEERQVRERQQQEAWQRAEQIAARAARLQQVENYLFHEWEKFYVDNDFDGSMGETPFIPHFAAHIQKTEFFRHPEAGLLRETKNAQVRALLGNAFFNLPPLPQ
jgi:hypothetical protein